MDTFFPGASSGTNTQFNQMMGSLSSQYGISTERLQDFMGQLHVNESGSNTTGHESNRNDGDMNGLRDMMSQMMGQQPNSNSNPTQTPGQMPDMNAIMRQMMSQHSQTANQTSPLGQGQMPDMATMMRQMETMFPGASSGSNTQMNNMLSSMMNPNNANAETGNMNEIMRQMMESQQRNRPAQPQPQPEIRFASQLVQLREMGFSDSIANLRALARSVY